MNDLRAHSVLGLPWRRATDQRWAGGCWTAEQGEGAVGEDGEDQTAEQGEGAGRLECWTTGVSGADTVEC
jgi:hypothetical protein